MQKLVCDSSFKKSRYTPSQKILCDCPFNENASKQLRLAAV